MYTLESTSILQLLRASRAATPPAGPAAALAGYEPLVQLMRREGLDRLDGDSLEISRGHAGSAKLVAIAESAGKPAWANRVHRLQQDSGRDSRNARLPEGTRLAFAFVDGNPDPASVRNDFHLVWKHLLAGGWAAFHHYAGDAPEVTTALNSLLTEYSAEIDRVERVKEQRVLLVRKRTPRTEWKKL